jgi:hypothetical protein
MTTTAVPLTYSPHPFLLQKKKKERKENTEREKSFKSPF